MIAKRASEKAVKRGYETWRDIWGRKIKELEDEGVTSHAEIARRLGLSAGYVRKIRLKLWE